MLNCENEKYEDLRSLEQELTFNIEAQAFMSKAPEFGAVQQQTLGIRDKDELYTNLGLLHSQNLKVLTAGIPLQFPGTLLAKPF